MGDAPRYRRVLLKISGEALMGDQGYGIDLGTVERFAGEVRDAVRSGIQVCLVIGGGNIFAVSRAPPTAWSVRAPTTWECWRR